MAYRGGLVAARRDFETGWVMMWSDRSNFFAHHATQGQAIAVQ
jgi:hypothetical protein